MKKRFCILIIEDDHRRIRWFNNQLTGHCDLDVFENAELGIKAVKENKYDIIFLDHDLGGRIFVPSDDPNTGYQVAKTLKESLNKDTRVIVHSFNPEGVDKIVSAIGKNAVKKPFGTFEIKFDENGGVIVKDT